MTEKRKRPFIDRSRAFLFGAFYFACSALTSLTLFELPVYALTLSLLLKAANKRHNFV
jgi:hypothetical protein